MMSRDIFPSGKYQNPELVHMIYRPHRIIQDLYGFIPLKVLSGPMWGSDFLSAKEKPRKPHPQPHRTVNRTANPTRIYQECCCTHHRTRQDPAARPVMVLASDRILSIHHRHWPYFVASCRLGAWFSTVQLPLRRLSTSSNFCCKHELQLYVNV